MAQAKKTSKEWNKRNIEIACRDCGYKTDFSQGALRAVARSGGRAVIDGDINWQCRECKAKDAIEMNKAIHAVYNRKHK